MTINDYATAARCCHWPGQKRCEVCGMGMTPSEQKQSSMSEHTPGPWMIYQGQLRDYVFRPQRTVYTDGADGFHAIAFCDYGDGKRAEANARLIAAAPQMAKENERLRTALKSILELDATNDLPDAWDIANDALQDITAIAKATGKA